MEALLENKSKWLLCSVRHHLQCSQHFLFCIFLIWRFVCQITECLIWILFSLCAKGVHTLGLSNNLIGKDELLNVVQPDITTGGEAIADMLMSNTTLRNLDLSWNAIRLTSAEQLGSVVGINSTLTKLNLAHNTFGDLGTQLLGQSLKVNSSLRSLDLSYNAIMPRAAMVLMNALCHNETLTFLNVDGNTIGPTIAALYIVTNYATDMIVLPTTHRPRRRADDGGRHDAMFW